MQPAANFGVASFASVTGIVCLTSANAYVIGALIHASATGQFQLFAGTTASSAAALSGIVGRATAAGSGVPSYIPFPAYASGGLTMTMVGSNDPKVTLFWNPAGGA